VDILFLLVPVSVLLVLGLMALFAWALQSGQFDDLRGEGERILAADGADLDEDQPRS
jgi:cbb3-type cytochrome oxidase maturation protein